MVSVTADSAVHDTFSVQAVVMGVQNVQSTKSKWLALVINPHCKHVCGLLICLAGQSSGAGRATMCHEATGSS